MHYDDVRDHLIRVVDMIDTMRDYLAGSLDIYTTQQTQRINQSLQRLTAISTVILPLTFSNQRLRDELPEHARARDPLRLLRSPRSPGHPWRRDALLPAQKEDAVKQVSPQPTVSYPDRGRGLYRCGVG